MNSAATKQKRSGRGSELIGSDGELFWGARLDGEIRTGHFVENEAYELLSKVTEALRENQAVLLLFRAK